MMPRILLIEDDQWLADSYMSVLRARGYEVTHLSTGHEAMASIDKQRPALIIADVLLGDHNTFTLFHELQSYGDTATIPVIICTGLGLAPFKDTDMASYGIVEVFDKATLTPDKLLLAVESYVSEQDRGLES